MAQSNTTYRRHRNRSFLIWNFYSFLLFNDSACLVRCENWKKGKKTSFLRIDSTEWIAASIGPSCRSLTCDQSPPASFSAPLRGTAPALHRDRRPLPAAAAADQTSQSYTTSQEEENQAGLDAELPLQQPNLPRRTSSKIRPTPVIRRCRMLEANEDPDLLLPPNSDKNTVKMPVQEQPETTTITAENGDVYRWKRDSTAPAAVRSDLYRGDAHNYDYSIGKDQAHGLDQSYTYMYIYIYIYICICVYIYMYTYIYMCVCICICVYVYVYTIYS